MATCPRCREFLDDGHVCQGMALRRIKQGLALTTAAVVGIVVGGVFFSVLGEAMAIRELEVIGMVAGPIIAVILVRAFSSL